MRIVLAFLISAIAAIAILPSVSTSQSDAAVLLAFKERIVSGNTTALASWKLGEPLSTWDGVTVSPADNTTVSELHLVSLGLKAELLPFWCDLHRIRVLDLRDNSFSGSPMSTWCTTLSSSLEVLFLHLNNLTGKLPNDMESTTLRILSLHRNSFSGKIPQSIGQLHQLRLLYLSYNQFTGEFPAFLSNCSRLQEVHLQENSLSGKLPQFSFQSLQYMDLSRNYIQGSIPMGLCSNCPLLETLYLMNTELGGAIRRGSLANCTRLERLNLSFNYLTGDPPWEEICSNTVISLSISGNNFSGIIPPSISNCTSLAALFASHNNLSGAIPTSMGNLSNLVVLNLANNQLTGNIPDVFKADALLLGSNRLTGTLPRSLAASSIQILDLHSNMLTGQIPPWLGGCSKLFFLNLRRNNFSGTVPPELGNLASLASKEFHNRTLNCNNCTPIGLYSRPLQLAGNSLSSQASTINFCHNQLTGEIPEQLGKLQGLQRLMICHNQLSGAIPASLSNLSSLEYVDLSGSNLSGTIPQELNRLSFLVYFDVSNNSLIGPLPGGTQFSTFNASWFQGNLALCGPPLGPCVSIPAPGPAQQHSDSEQHLPLANPIAVGAVAGFSAAFWIVILPRWTWLDRKLHAHLLWRLY